MKTLKSIKKWKRTMREKRKRREAREKIIFATHADLTQAISMTINEMRKAFAIQDKLQKEKK